MRGKVALLEKKKGCCRSYGVTRCEICKHLVTTETFISFSTHREYSIKPDNCRSSNVVYFFSCKHAQNNTQVVLKAFDLDLTITSQPIGVSLKGIPSNMRHFTVTLRITNIMVWMIGKLPSLAKQIVYTILGEESLFGSMN